jgi:hypothetical protein
MTEPLDLAPYILRDGASVITARTMSDRARRAYAVKRAGQLRECREKFA